MPAKQSKRWTFTINNYDEETIARIGALHTGGELAYVCYGREIAPSTGTCHLQGFAVFRTKRSLGGVKKHPPFDRAHLEIARGTVQDNVDYCGKEGQFTELGEKPAQGRRTDLEAVKRAIDGGASILDVADEHFALFLQYGRQFDRYRNLRLPERSSPTRGYWFFGPTGVGKTRRAYAIGLQLGRVYFAPDSEVKWVDGYEQQETIIIDDLTPESKPGLGLLLRILDRYPMQLPVKGGFAKFNSARVIITSNYTIEEVYGSYKNFASLERRVTIKEFK